MNRALGLLIWLRFRGWWRRLGRNLATVRGALFVAFGILLSGCWIASLFVAPRSSDTATLEAARRFAPLVMLAYCLLTVLTSAADRSLTFSPAEVNLLFAGPFTRRQLLAYKILTGAIGTLLSSLLFLLFLRVYTPWLPAAFLALFLALLFLQLFGIAVALVSETVGEYASTAKRRVALVLLGLLAVSILFSVGREALTLPPVQLLERVEASPVVQLLLTPFRWFGETFTAQQLWPDLVRGAALCLAVDGVLLALVFLLDAHYLEAASAASERTYRRLERMRAGPAAAMSAGGSARFTLGNLPNWGGIGSLAWRQALTAVRNLKGLVFILLTFAVFLAMPLLVRQGARDPDSVVPPFLRGSFMVMSIFLLQLLSFDFRGDLDRMEVLKSLPIAPSRVVLGQLLTPVLMATILHLAGFVVIELSWGGWGLYLALVPLFVLPFNLLLFEVMNLLFLWFPTRMTPATAGDFQMMGRQMMLFFGIYLLVFVLAGGSALAGVLAYWLLKSVFAGFAVGWGLLMGIVVGLVPLLARAFRNFDVARDTPP